jgi:hypothetical protein
MDDTFAQIRARLEADNRYMEEQENAERKTTEASQTGVKDMLQLCKADSRRHVDQVAPHAAR